MRFEAVNARHQAALDFLFSRIDYERALAVPYREREYRLDRMQRLLHLLGNPQQGQQIVHIAGTKGKGSTATMLASILSTAGYRCGVFSSPHLHEVEERFSIDGQPCPHETFVELVEALRAAVEQLDAEAAERNEQGPTYFELTTAIALMHFARAGCDYTILEVGMGGRLDSTNVCQPVCTAITSISYDHTKQLGTTLDAIAREKAGIIKAGVPMICGAESEDAVDAIAEIAEQQGVPLRQIHRDFNCVYPSSTEASGPSPFMVELLPPMTPAKEQYEALSSGLLGRHQAHNAAVAIAILAELRQQGCRVSDLAIRDGLRDARCPARVELLQTEPAILVDAAHNVASARALVDTLRENFPASHRSLVFASTLEKDHRGIFEVLLPHFDDIVLTRYTNNPRSVDPAELAELAASLGASDVTLLPDPQAAWQWYRERLAADGLLCVTGSFFIAAEMREAILANPLRRPAPRTLRLQPQA